MPSPSMQALWKSSPLSALNAPYLEELYDAYIQDPTSVSDYWRHYFENTLKLNNPALEPHHQEIQEQFRHWAQKIPSAKPAIIPSITEKSEVKPQSPKPKLSRKDESSESWITEKTQTEQKRGHDLAHEIKQIQVLALIDAYRLLGHLHADIDPLKMREKPLVPELMLAYHHLSEGDLSQTFEAGSLPGGSQRPLKKIIEDLRTIYCGTIASEFLHIPDSTERIWVQERVEERILEPSLSVDIKLSLLARVNAAEGLEKYLNAKFPGAKRFSLEGNDTLIIALDEIIQQGGVLGIKEMVIGMAHRGRLNILMNILGKDPGQILDEFEGKVSGEILASGDVKYHQGFSSDIQTEGGPVHVALAFNPSHLEIVSPVVCGSVRARQDKRGDLDRRSVLAIILHGDASIAGQGVVMETLNMSRTHAYATGGSVHIIVNNQIGFTTSDPRDARSTLYCSDIGKMLEVPIFHVNADDPEAVYYAIRLALDYRNQFKKDVIVDLIGYRRHGHNEADEPAVTQPLMYKVIRNLPTVRAIYGNRLIEEGLLQTEALQNMETQYRDRLEQREACLPRNLVPNHEPTPYSNNWERYFNDDGESEIKTGVPIPLLQVLSNRLEEVPEGFVVHPRIQKLLAERHRMSIGEIPLDWGYAETLAYATLVNEGVPVRMSGQDSCRGTFFHRQAVLHDQITGYEYTPLANISSQQAPFTIYDSLLSEEGVLGFEYGYASSNPNKLVIWEAQFGDFANNAQVVIDQFISSGEQKWQRLCGLVMLLPHGYEGQGPEHSSARLERYLQLCAQHNMQVCIPSTPAQIFHLLRRQILRSLRKPLIVLTPKSLLRHKLAVSTLEDIAQGSFQRVIPEIDKLDSKEVTRILLCGGKIYYDLLEARRSDELSQVAIFRIEQLYPFPEDILKEALSAYPNANEIVWCQEEPQNQGAWYSSRHHLQSCLREDQALSYVGREPAASPAVGYHHLHLEQQASIVQAALAISAEKRG